MLADDYQDKLSRLVGQLQDRIELPEEWADDYFAKSGTLPTTINERRRFARHRARGKGVLEIGQTLPSISRKSGVFLIYTFDIARGGLGFLHESQLFPCETATLWLQTAKLKVEVTRCRYLTSRCHLIGAVLA